ncbi:MAG: hypothetical protein ISS57_05745 [Anaerolineales bacterium]|nr:hypothetical protein [Anaerolineales bacterium]
MPSKNIGFSRTIFLSWLDATAALCLRNDDPLVIRQALDPIVGKHLTGVDARRKTIDVLISIWHKSAQLSPLLHADALKLYQEAYVSLDYLWLHYGLTLLYYPLFRHITLAIGQISRIEDTITRDVLKKRIASEFGHLGALDRSVERISASLTDWGILPATKEKSIYKPARNELATDSRDLELWLLACALRAHPAESLPFADLLRLPELFPFRFTANVEDIRSYAYFEIQREGTGWDMVRLSNDVGT